MSLTRWTKLAADYQKPVSASLLVSKMSNNLEIIENITYIKKLFLSMDIAIEQYIWIG